MNLAKQYGSIPTSPDDIMDAIQEKAADKAKEEATDKIKENAGLLGCFASCLGPKVFMMCCGCCLLDEETREAVNNLLDKVD